MRCRLIILVIMIALITSITTAAIIHESTFDSASGVDPTSSGDATYIWATDGQWSGGTFGYYDYNGAGQLELNNPAHNWDDPYMELDVSSVTGDIEIILDCLPLVTADTVNQGVVLAMTDAVTGGSNWTSGEVAVIINVQRGIVHAVFTDNPGYYNATSKLAQTATLPIPAADLTKLQIILTHDDAASVYKAYLLANDGEILEFPNSFNIARTKSTVNVTSAMWFSSLEEAFTTQLDNLSVGDTITFTNGVNLSLQDRTFSGVEDPYPTTDPFYPISIGDLNAMYKDNAQVFNYNGTGQLIVGHPAVNSGWPNAKVNLLSGLTDTVQLVIDVTPGFTNDGILQMFNVTFNDGDGNSNIFVANAEGAGEGVGIFWWQDDIFALDVADAAAIPVAAANINALKLILTYDSGTQMMELFYSVNDGYIFEHPNSPQSIVRNFDQIEFQWQVWSSSNPSAYTVGLDNVAEFNEITAEESTLPLAADEIWSLYE